MTVMTHLARITWLVLSTSGLASAWVGPARVRGLRRLKAAALARPLAAHATAVGSADLDWPTLGFEFRETKSHLKFTYSNGAWNEGELVDGEPYVKVWHSVYNRS